MRGCKGNHDREVNRQYYCCDRFAGAGSDKAGNEENAHSLQLDPGPTLSSVLSKIEVIVPGPIELPRAEWHQRRAEAS